MMDESLGCVFQKQCSSVVTDIRPQYSTVKIYCTLYAQYTRSTQIPIIGLKCYIVLSISIRKLDTLWHNLHVQQKTTVYVKAPYLILKTNMKMN